MKLKQLFLAIFTVGSLLTNAQTSDSAILEKHVTYLASEELEGRGLGTKGKDLATTYIQGQFSEAGLQPFQGDFLQKFCLEVGMIRVNATNVIGIVEGTDPTLKNEYVVIGAHYDHLGYTTNKKDEKIFYPGADDNASGVAAIIELAKHFAKAENKPKRSLLFIAFDAEEIGLRGSNHFVKTLDQNMLNNIKAMFSFDMVGMLSANKGLNLKGIATITNGKEIAQKHAGDIKLFKANSDIEERTDTEPFGAIGIPAIHVFTGTKSPYHRPEDKADLLDYQGIAKVVDYMGKVITEIANQSTEIKPVAYLDKLRENEKAVYKRFQAGVVLNIGSGKHLYKDEFFDAKSAFAYSVGLQANYKITRITHLNLEVLYDYNTSESANGTFKRNSLTLPFNVEFGTATNSGRSTRVFVFGGPYYRYNFDGKDGGQSLDFENTFREKEWGYNLGIGADFGNIRFAFTFRKSFDSVLQEGAKIQPFAGYLTLGYRF